MKICFYCSKTFLKDTEHVFPRGLGGESLYMDNVCEECNGYFSKLERELYQKSPISLMRSTEGVEGHNPNPDTPAPLKANLILTQDERHGIIYEVGQYKKMQTFIRPQVILFEGNYYLEGNTLTKPDLLWAQLRKWLNAGGVFIAYEKGCLQRVKFTETGTFYKKDQIAAGKGPKLSIRYTPIPKSHRLYNDLTPRLYIDDDRELRVRAKTAHEAETFLHQFLNYSLTGAVFNSFPSIISQQTVIEVALSFDGLQFDQALVKIALNVITYYFPEQRTNLALTPLVRFVMNGSPAIQAHWDQKNPLYDNNDGTHNILFQSGDHTNIRISLFNGNFVFALWISDLKLFTKTSYARLLVDYKSRKHVMQDSLTYLNSFSL